MKEKLAAALSGPVAAFALVIPLTVYYFTLYLKYPEQMSLLDDWFLFVFSLTLLFYGYLLGGSARFWESCSAFRFYFSGIAIACMIVLFYRYWWQMSLPKEKNSALYLFGILNAVHIWSVILAVLGFAKKHFNFSNRFLQYANQAVYPFYILHQTIIVVAGYYVVQWSLPVFIKMIVLVIICFSTLALLYHFLIKRFVLTRILYGLKPRDKKICAAPASSEAGIAAV